MSGCCSWIATTRRCRRRYTETRRRHPLAIDRQVADGIAADRNVVCPLRDHADLIIDTTVLSIHDLRRQLEGQFSIGGEPGCLCR